MLDSCSAADLPLEKFFEYVIVFDNIQAPFKKDKESGKERKFKKTSKRYKAWRKLMTERGSIEARIRKAGLPPSGPRAKKAGVGRQRAVPEGQGELF